MTRSYNEGETNEWLREQIAFAIFNSTNPPHVRDSISLKRISSDPALTSDLGDGWTATSNFGLDWRLNKRSFLSLADVAIKAFEAADANGSAYDNALKRPEPDTSDPRDALIKELMGALSWYGEQSRLARLIHSEGDAGRSALANDGGKRAREALSKAKGVVDG